MRTNRWARLLPFLLLSWAVPALAQQAGGSEALVIMAENRTAAAEAERGAPRADDQVRRGDLIRYTLVFTNPTEGPVQNVVLHNPLAEGLQYVAGSAAVHGAEARIEYSIDRGATFAAQPMIEVVEEGRTVRRPAPPELYTDVRWTVETQVQPGAKVTASYEARLPSEAPTAAGVAGGSAISGDRSNTSSAASSGGTSSSSNAGSSNISNISSASRAGRSGSQRP